MGAAVLASGVASVVGVFVWNRATARAVTRLNGSAATVDAETYRPEMLQGLPSPVARYFEFALRPGSPIVRSARVEHEGEFRTSPDAAWGPFRSVQHFRVGPPGFVWDAKIRMGRVLNVRVRDSYLNGRGAMQGRILGLIPVVNVQGTPEISSGSLHRYLAEAVWFPTALLPGPGIEWTEIDDTTALVSLSDAGITVSLQVGFNERNEIVRVHADRLRDVNGVGVPTPWTGHFRAYAEREGMQIPMEGEVEWIYPEGPFAYWRGRITESEYRFDR